MLGYISLLISLPIQLIFSLNGGKANWKEIRSHLLDRGMLSRIGFASCVFTVSQNLLCFIWGLVVVPRTKFFIITITSNTMWRMKNLYSVSYHILQLFNNVCWQMADNLERIFCWKSSRPWRYPPIQYSQSGSGHSHLASHSVWSARVEGNMANLSSRRKSLLINELASLVNAFSPFPSHSLPSNPLTVPK